MGNTQSDLPYYRERLHQDKYDQTQTNSHDKSNQTDMETGTNSLDKSTQTKMKTQTNSVQTAVTFLDRLTHNHVNTVDSSEIFEDLCETCDKSLENQAVGICKTCRQYMCLQCCNIHERISWNRCHRTVTKAEFKTEIIPKSKYFQKLAPISRVLLKIDNYFKNDQFKVGIFNALGSGDILFWTLQVGPNQHHFYNEILLNISHIDQQSGQQSQICSAYYKKCSTKEYKEAQDFPESKKLVYFAVPQNIPGYYRHRETTTVYKYCHSERAVAAAFKHNDVCTSVVPFNKGLALSVFFKTDFSCPDWFIRCVDYKGNIKKQIGYDQDGNQLFGEPRYLATNQAEDTLFISDYKWNCVLALDIYDQILYKFQHEFISKPLGITCDEEHNVYVACGKSVVQIDSEANQCRKIVTSTQKAEIVNVCYNPVSEQLAVADNSVIATIFEFL